MFFAMDWQELLGERMRHFRNFVECKRQTPRIIITSAVQYEYAALTLPHPKQNGYALQ